MAVSMSVTVNDAVSPLIAKIQRRLQSAKPAMKIIGEIVRSSVVRNFERGGRPQAWKPLSPVTQHLRGATGPILRRQGFAGGLMGSINVQAHSDRVEIGTNKIYGAVHQFGAKKGDFGTVTAKVPAHKRRISQAFGRPIKPRTITVGAHTRRMQVPWGDIPARRYLMVQPRDWDEIRSALADYLARIK